MAPPSLWLYRLLVAGALPLVVPALALADRVRDKRRPSLASRLARRPPALPRGGLWLQAVSVGEVELARRLLVELSARDSTPVLLTATTATGLELARRTLEGRATVMPCPLDLPGAVRRVLEAACPAALALVETELWPEMLHQAGRRRVPVAVVNARLSEGAFVRYRRVRWPLRSLLEPVTRVLARSPADAERFAALGVPAPRLVVTGNVKYDLDADRTPLPWVDRLRELARGRPVVVAGSTMAGEEELVTDAVARLRRSGLDPFLVLAPRHPERFDVVARGLAEEGLAVARRSQPEDPAGADMLLLDTIGELGRAYRFAAAAFVGGSLAPTGGHNPLEPAVWGVPVLTGPHVHNFAEVYDALLAAGAARVVGDAGSLAGALGEWLVDETARRRAGAAGQGVVAANRGALRRTVDELLALMGRKSGG